MKTDQSNRADIRAVLGASGTGKSSYVKKFIKRPKNGRLLIFDPMHEYGDYGEVFKRLEPLLAALKGAGEKGKFCFVFQPIEEHKTREKAFNLVCGAARAAGNLTFIAEELKFVTQPSYAPPYWAALSLTGRHKGIQLIGTSQRPASIDKDFLGNATVIRTGRLVYAPDIKTVADVLQVSPEEIKNLPDLHYIERDMQTGKTSQGVLKL